MQRLQRTATGWQLSRWPTGTTLALEPLGGALLRAAQGLSDSDLQELQRFAEYQSFSKVYGASKSRRRTQVPD